VAHTWCPTGTAGSAGGATNAAISAFYPQADSVSAATDILAATTDGKHILGAALGTGGIALSDIGFDTKEQAQFSAICPQTGTTLGALNLGHTLNQTQIAADATTVNQLVASPPPTLLNGNKSQAPSFAFITYDGTTAGAKLPYYVPNSDPTALGTVGYVALKGASRITAPVAGAFSPDNTLFFVSTAGDNRIHYIAIPTSATAVPTDTQQISPNLPACVPQSATDPYCTNPLGTPKGSLTPATVITVKPRSTT